MNELRQKINHALTGPVVSIPTPFLDNGEIDYPTIGQMIDFQIASGFRMIFLTPGNSHYNCLRDAEIAEMCRFTVEYTAGRVPVCVCNFFYGTADTLKFAEFAAGCGADLLLPFPPNWALSVTPATLTDYYVEVSRVMPLMLIFSPLGGTDGAISNIEKTLDRSDRILAIKDDLCTPLSRQMTISCRERCAVFAGGQKQNFLNIRPYGATGFLSTIGLFKPEITWRFWNALENDDRRTAMEIIEKIDMPLFRYLVALPGSFDAGIHAIMEIFGFGSRVRRAPYYNLSDGEVDALKELLHKISIL